jgi:glycine cleavage system aminomethyltransferase T
VATLCTLTVDDHVASDGRRRYMLGGEPVLTAEGVPIVDAAGRHCYVTSAGSAPSLGKHVLLAYLPTELASAGRQLAVEYMSEQFPVTVSVTGATPLFDPANERVRS